MAHIVLCNTMILLKVGMAIVLTPNDLGAQERVISN